MIHHVEVPPICLGHYRGCCGAVEAQRVPLECARGGEEPVGVNPVIGDLTGDENTMVSVGSSLELTQAPCQRLGVGERLIRFYSFSKNV